MSWKWGQGHPSGTVKDVVDDTAEVKTKRGNTVKKDGDEENPAVVLNTGQSDAVKKVRLEGATGACPHASTRLMHSSPLPSFDRRMRSTA